MKKIFYYLDLIHSVKSVCIRSYSTLYSVGMRENKDQNNPEYGHVLRSGCFSIVQSFLGFAVLVFSFSLKKLFLFSN